MIIICEPTCKGFSHEKINEGFIFKIRFAFPKEKLLIFAHSSHIKVLKRNFLNDKLSQENIFFKKISVAQNTPIIEFFFSIKTFLKIKRYISRYNVKNVFFLSFSKLHLFIFKQLSFPLKANKVFVLHGHLEEAAPIKNQVSSDLMDEIPRDSFFNQLKKITFKKVLIKTKQNLKRIDPLYYYLTNINILNIIKTKHGDDFHYIAISNHIINNLNGLINVESYNISCINYPQVQSMRNFEYNNQNVKFGVFGYGDSKTLYNLCLKISKSINLDPFKIKIIGMDNRVAKYFPFVTAPSNGKPLTRNQMEDHLEDIDYLLIFYDEHKYRLCCSASIIEAITYSKPIIHLKNDCISHFNKDNNIGFECKNLEEFKNKMVDIINNYDVFKEVISKQKLELLKTKKRIAVSSDLEKFKKIFIRNV